MAIFVPQQKFEPGKGNFRPYYPFYSYHPLPQLTIEKQLGEFVDTHGSILCIGEKRDYRHLSGSDISSVRGRCELLGETGEVPGRVVFRITASKPAK